MIFIPIRGRLFRVSQRFGERPEYYEKYGHEGHNGIDFAPLWGMPAPVICAPHEGYVMVGDEGKLGYGKYVNITSLPYQYDGTQRRSDLAHLKEIWVRPGQFVSAGDQIGVMGSTGDSTATHLHWTYKKARDGKTLGKDNGFKGALDIGQFAAYWGNTLTHL